MDPALVDIGPAFGVMVMIGRDGLRKESITFKVTNDKSVTLRGWRKNLASILVLFSGAVLLALFVTVILIIATG